MDYLKKYEDCLKYIDNYWNLIIHKPTKKIINKNLITIPYPFITPNSKKFSYMFYWDTFFMFRGIIRTKREWILKDMVNNFIYIYGKYGIIPNFNSPASMGRSQPPFLTSMILDVYNGYYFGYVGKNKFRKILSGGLIKHKKWLKTATATAKLEYSNVWMDPDGTYNHKVKGYILARYGDRDIGYAHSSELESGWDFTSRFYNRCSDFLPIDLNVLLFKYERDFAKIAFHLENTKEENEWKKIGDLRKKEINKLMWDEEKGFFFDYSYKSKRKSDFWSLAGFVPLWAGLPTASQAEKIVKNLKMFETDFGLTITSKKSLAPQIDLDKIPSHYRPAIEEVITPKQWDYPNSWPPLEYLTVVGLMKYGFLDDAKRLMNKYLDTHSKLFRKYNTFFEKINGATGDVSASYHYESQSGFGWTNAIFYRYVQILESIDKGIYKSPKPNEPPYSLSIPH